MPRWLRRLGRAGDLRPPTRSLVVPVFPGCQIICRPATLPGLEPAPFSPDLDQRAGIEPAFQVRPCGQLFGARLSGLSRHLPSVLGVLTGFSVLRVRCLGSYVFTYLRVRTL